MKTLIIGLIAAIALSSWGAETNECSEASIKAFVERVGGQTLGAKFRPTAEMSLFNLPGRAVVTGYLLACKEGQGYVVSRYEEGDKFAGVILSLPIEAYYNPTKEKSINFIAKVAKELNLQPAALTKPSTYGALTITPFPAKTQDGQSLTVGVMIRGGHTLQTP